MTSSSPPPVNRSPAAPQAGWQRLRRTLQHTPLTFAIIGFTLLIFLGQLISQLLLGIDLVLIFGGKSKELIAAGQTWRILTPLFIHVGLWHVAVNMYSLYALGPATERFFGSGRFLVVYLLSGICGVMFSVAFQRGYSVGASGSIFGLLGALATFLYMHRELFGQGGRLQFRQLAIVAALNLMLGFSPGIDNWGHLGGLAGGIVLTLLLGPRYEILQSGVNQPPVIDRRPWPKMIRGSVLAGILILALTLAAAYLPTGG